MKKIITCFLILPMSIFIAVPAFANLVTPAGTVAAEPRTESVKNALAEFKNLSKK